MTTVQMVNAQGMSDTKRLFKTVVEGGYCIGCGACAYSKDSPIKIDFDERGCYQAKLKDPHNGFESQSEVSSVCPFSEKAIDEDTLARQLYGTNCIYHDKIGYYSQTFAGYIIEGDFRESGSSGGFGSWITYELLNRKLIDGVIHIKERDVNDATAPMFSYGVSFSESEIKKGAKSRYYPIEMSNVLQYILENPGRYAIVGIPCFIKAVRLLSKKDPVINERVKFCIGIVCGHLKSKRFAEMFAWQCGITPDQLLSVNFRKKIDGQGANRYGIEVVGKQGSNIIKEIKTNDEFYGHDWGQGFFKYEACDYCDDVLAETADVAIGDAWLPQYIADSKGTNIIVVRNQEIASFIQEAISTGRIYTEQISADDVAQSQDAGLRHRREGLAYRLYLKDKEKSWRPVKRFKAEHKHLDERQKKIQQTRKLLAEASHKAFLDALAARDFEVFKRILTPLVKKYSTFYPSLTFKARVKRKIKKLLGMSL